MAVSIREVASRVGVSTATVSRVLNGLRDVPIAEQTRDRVLTAAREMGYHPNTAARSLRSRRTDVLGIVLPPVMDTDNMVGDPFFGALLQSTLRAAGLHHKDVMVYMSGQQAQDFSRFRDGRCDGLLVFYQPPHSDFLSNVLEGNVPVVLVDDQRDDPRLSCVDVDNTDSARRMTEYLIGLGHRRIAALSSDGLESSYVALRDRGYRAALQANNIPFDQALRCYDAHAWVPQAVVAAVERLMTLPPDRRPTALFCYADDVAALVTAALTWRGLRIPQDISVAGFNDDARAVQLDPPLTTLRQPFRELGNTAVELLLEQIADPACRGRKLTLPTELIIRGSTGPVPECQY